MMKRLHYLKIYRKFAGAVMWGIMSWEKVESIAAKTWEIEELLAKQS